MRREGSEYLQALVGEDAAHAYHHEDADGVHTGNDFYDSTSVKRVKPDKTIRNKAAKPRTHSMSFQKGVHISTF